MFDYIEKLKKETNNIKDIVYREKTVKKKKLCIIYNEPLVSSDKISDFVIRSLNNIDQLSTKNILDSIENNIYNFKVTTIKSYEEMCEYIHRGFTAIILEDEVDIIILETKGNIKRGITAPNTENSYRGPNDSFIEDYQTNMGLIKKRIKCNDLWIDNFNIGKYTDTMIGLVYINGVCKKNLVDKIKKQLEKINIDGIINSGVIKNLIEKENKNVFPTTITSERPDRICAGLLQGKIAIVVDNDPYVLLLPAVLNDFFKSIEDYSSKSFNATFTRIIRYIAFFIALFTPAIYIALITHNQEMIPTDLLINFTTQRSGVPFPAFFEAIFMMIAFEILRESDLRTPGFTGSSISIVGALILGDAAVAAGIVSPIMIIIIALTAISSLPFSEYELINCLRWYRILLMIGASFLGVIGVVVVFLYFMITIAALESYGKPYLLPFAPANFAGLKDSIIKFATKNKTKRPRYLSNNETREKNEN